MSQPITIDAHQHFWDREDLRFDHSWQEASGMEAICRSFLPADLEPLLAQHGIDYSVCVQTQHNVAEHRWVLELADQHQFIAGVVGWVDLASELCEEQVEEFVSVPKFVGVRHVTQDEPDDDFIVSEAIGEGLAVLEKFDLPFDLLFYEKHLKHAKTVADRFPSLRLVIDHLSKPQIKQTNFQADAAKWRKELSEAAQRPNVYCKLSGMITEAEWSNWSTKQIRPYFDFALECFGPERLMFGSDWPVCNLAGDYGDVVRLARECTDSLSDSEQASIFGETARQFYRLDV